MDIKKSIETARSELKNIRQQLETLKRVHTKEVSNIKTLLSEARRPSCKCGTETEPDPGKLTGQAEILWHFKPVGHIQSTFKNKNGTPRQSGLCQTARATLTIPADVFSNPGHSMEGLEEFSHVWILFVFHKNNNAYNKAKVKPPRLNGARVGLFSTRSPYRPNPIGLSLCRVERVEGSTLHLSGVDLLDGTPVLDIKPYIPEYDQLSSAAVNSAPPARMERAYSEPEYDQPSSPAGSSNTLACTETANLDSHCGSPSRKCKALDTQCETASVPVGSPRSLCEASDASCKASDPRWRASGNECEGLDAGSEAFHAADVCQGLERAPLQEAVAVEDDENLVKSPSEKDHVYESSKRQSASVASWLKEPPVQKLAVRFTPCAKEQVAKFERKSCGDYKLEHLKDSKEVAAAIMSILECDPRSSYRRKQCQDKLYYFTVDEVHATCWFDGDEVEVLKVQPLTWATRRRRGK